MVGRVALRWADLTRRTADLIPWRVGPRANEHGSEFVYWRPVEDAVNERIAREVDVDRWLAGGPFEHVLVELGRSGLMLFAPGRVTKLEVPDEVARSRDLAAVGEFLFTEAVAALAAIGKRYALGAPPSRPAGEPAPKRGQLADLVARHQRQLVLVSPRYRHRPSLESLLGELDDLGEEAGWGVFGAEPKALSPTADLSAHYDFADLPRCVDLERSPSTPGPRSYR